MNMKHPNEGVLCTTPDYLEEVQFEATGRKVYKVENSQPEPSKRRDMIKAYDDDVELARQAGTMLPVLVAMGDCLGTGMDGLQVSLGLRVLGWYKARR